MGRLLHALARPDQEQCQNQTEDNDSEIESIHENPAGWGDVQIVAAARSRRGQKTARARKKCAKGKTCGLGTESPRLLGLKGIAPLSFGGRDIRLVSRDVSSQDQEERDMALADETKDTAAPAAPDKSLQRHPPAIWFFFWGEFAERSSYYGMRTILLLYLTTALQFADRTAAPIYSAFKMACYFLPLLGGYIADRWLGRYWTIVGFSVPYVLGQFLLGIPNQVTLLIALILLAGGSGVIKPNISTLMGQTYDQKRPGQESLRSAAFLWFYLSINIGALISSVALPIVRDRYIESHLTEEARAEFRAKTEAGEEVKLHDLATTE